MDVAWDIRRTGRAWSVSQISAWDADGEPLSARVVVTDEGIRVEVDDSSDRMGNKIRKAQEQKIPYMLVVGDKEAQAGAVAVRLRSNEDLGPRPVEEFIAMAQAAVKEKRNL